jgi:L-galactono-1,4-lactone dehydrogenase
MRHLLHFRRRRRTASPPATATTSPSQVSSDADLRKCAGYTLVLLDCGAATYYSFPFPADALHNKGVPLRYAPLPEDLRTVSN